jgi:hypothetical protein
MLPRLPEVVKCRACPTAYWLNSANIISEPDRSMSGSSGIPWVEEPTEQQYHDALTRGLATSPGDEIRLRVLAWWRANDRGRFYEEDGPAPLRPLTQAFRENLEILLSLLDDEQPHLLMRAEALRQLGRFDDAEHVLLAIDGEYAWVADQIAEHCRNRNTAVRLLDLPGDPQYQR